MIPSAIPGDRPRPASTQRLSTSASPSTTGSTAQSTRFSGLPENAIQQFFADTAGVYAPKLPYMRSWLQFFEDTFLEGVEDAAWYFIIPGLGPALAQWFGRQVSGKGLTAAKTAKAIGTPLHQLEGQLSKLPVKTARQLVGAKAGTLLSGVGLMCAAEYMVQHNKNWLTAKLFNTKNFTAVAGLEQPRAKADTGEQDPVHKATRRNVQVLTALAATLLGSVALAKGVAGSPKGFEAAKKVMKWVDFAPGMDVSKSILALGIGTGVVSYLDAARNNLERKELASRLAIVVPYLLFGKELAGNAVAWLTQKNMKVALPNGQKVAIDQLKSADGKPFSFLKSTFNYAKTPWQAPTFLDFNAVKKSVYSAVMAMDLPAQSKETILQSFNSVSHNKFLLCTAVMSAWLAILINAQTRNRFNKMKKEDNPFPGSSTKPAKLYGSSAFSHFQTRSLATSG